MPVTNFNEWVSAAQPGDVLVYHTGHLSQDRQRSRRLNETAKLAAEHQRAGRVTLTQDRALAGYLYIAQRTPTPEPLVTPHMSMAGSAYGQRNRIKELA